MAERSLEYVEGTLTVMARFRGATSSLVLAPVRWALSAAGPGERRRQNQVSA